MNKQQKESKTAAADYIVKIKKVRKSGFLFWFWKKKRQFFAEKGKNGKIRA